MTQQDTIQSLQQRLAELQAGNPLANPIYQNQPVQPVQQFNQVPPPPAQDELQAQVDELRAMIKGMVAEEVRLVLSEPSSQKPQPGKSNPMPAILSAIGKVLTVEEQEWLSKYDVLTAIPDYLPAFLESDDGKLLIRTFVDAYRGSK